MWLKKIYFDLKSSDDDVINNFLRYQEDNYYSSKSSRGLLLINDDFYHRLERAGIISNIQTLDQENYIQISLLKTKGVVAIRIEDATDDMKEKIILESKKKISHLKKGDIHDFLGKYEKRILNIVDDYVSDAKNEITFLRF